MRSSCPGNQMPPVGSPNFPGQDKIEAVVRSSSSLSVERRNRTPESLKVGKVVGHTLGVGWP